MASKDWDGLISKAERVLELLERRLAGRPAEAPEPEATGAWAYRWRAEGLEPIEHPDLYPLEGLIGVERSVERLRANLAAFTSGSPALDVLLYGERGTGKSSAVRGLLREFGPLGLRLLEVHRDDLRELPRLYAALRKRTERFAIFCDDLAFEGVDLAYRELKAALDGGLEARPANVLILATSNRRYLVAEKLSENRDARHASDGEIHPGETTEEKISLSDRFGLLLPFLGFDQPTYLRIVDYHAGQLGLRGRLSADDLARRALRYALERSSRSGRTARHACIRILQELEKR